MKKIIGIILVTIWRIWFVILAAIPILIMLPLLVIAVSFEKLFPIFYRMARLWAYIIFFGMGFRVSKTIKQKIARDKNYMFIANHSSMMDIMLMFILIKKPFLFVGKAELGKIPIFGFIYKRTAIMVDRKSPESRKAVFDEAQRRIQQGRSICIFPEGGVPDRSVLLDKFKKGAFYMAIEHQLPIVPITFCDLKYKYPFEWFYGKPAKIKATFHKHIEVNGLTKDDAPALTEESWKLIYDALLSCDN